MKHTSSTIVKVYLIIAFTATLFDSSYGRSTWAMQADEANNEVDDEYPSQPINVCNESKHISKQRIDRRRTKELLGHFLIQLQHVATVSENEINHLSKKCDISPKHYRNHGLKNLNPRRSKRTNKKLKIPKNRQAQQLFETLWWLTAMNKAVHEVTVISGLSKNSTLKKEIEKISYSLQFMLQSMKIQVPYKSSLCYREQTIDFPLAQVDYTKGCAYGFLALQDVSCGIKQIVKELNGCKIVFKGRKRRTTARLRCKRVKSVFFQRRKKKIDGCQRRRKLGTWSKLRV